MHKDNVTIEQRRLNLSERNIKLAEDRSASEKDEHDLRMEMLRRDNEHQRTLQKSQVDGWGKLNELTNEVDALLNRSTPLSGADASTINGMYSRYNSLLESLDPQIKAAAHAQKTRLEGVWSHSRTAIKNQKLRDAAEFGGFMTDGTPEGDQKTMLDFDLYMLKAEGMASGVNIEDPKFTEGNPGTGLPPLPQRGLDADGLGLSPWYKNVVRARIKAFAESVNAKRNEFGKGLESEQTYTITRNGDVKKTGKIKADERNDPRVREMMREIESQSNDDEEDNAGNKPSNGRTPGSLSGGSIRIVNQGGNLYYQRADGSLTPYTPPK